jgi:hypothetical protein
MNEQSRFEQDVRQRLICDRGNMITAALILVAVMLAVLVGVLRSRSHPPAPITSIPLTGTGTVIYQTGSWLTIRFEDNHIMEYQLCPDSLALAYQNMVVTIQLERGHDDKLGDCYYERGAIEFPDKEKEVPIHNTDE